MLFRFISNDEYEELTNPDHVNEAMENNFERFGDGTIQSESKNRFMLFTIISTRPLTCLMTKR